MNELVKQFDAMAQVMTAMAGKGVRDRMKMVRELQSGAMANPAGQLSRQEAKLRQTALPAGKGETEETAGKRDAQAAPGR